MAFLPPPLPFTPDVGFPLRAPVVNAGLGDVVGGGNLSNCFCRAGGACNTDLADPSIFWVFDVTNRGFDGETVLELC